MAARAINRQETAEEDRRAKLPKNFEAKKRKEEWEEADEKARKVCESVCMSVRLYDDCPSRQGCSVHVETR